MRAGLVGIGALFLAVATVSGGVLYLTPLPQAGQTITSEFPSIPSSPNQTRMVLIPGPSDRSAGFTFTWQATQPYDVELYEAPGCLNASLGCASGPAVVTWTGNVSGRYATNGEITFPYLLVWTDRSTSTALLGATATCIWNVAPTASIWTLVAEMGAAGALAIVGGVILFLGLFVRSGVYRRSAPPAPPPEPDGTELTAPRTGSLAAGAEPPRPGPPAPVR